SDIFLEGSALKKERIKNLIISYQESLSEQIPQEYFYDFGASEPFSLAGRGPGECGAGVMDLIQLDLDEAREALKTAEKAQRPEDRNSNLYKALISGARALLITFGLEPGNDREIFGAFIRQLVEPGWVEPESRDLINAAMDWRMGDRESIDDPARKITDLINRIEKLFQSLDSNLNFRLKPVVNNTGNTENRAGGHIVDLRGVACPLNFVKAKLELEKIDIGEIIDFLLDDGEPVRNVPASFQEQGQDVVEVEKSGGHFRVRVRRKE
ncbi:MAG: sulfurtransferase TusA family protein, partial [Spirochaetes bacterium]|nr:sulfurtransferase TusA family protein [Spirochaetota bacterium]